MNGTEFGGIAGALFLFAFHYPLLMSWIWMLGGLYFYLHWERASGSAPDAPPPLAHCPPVSILLPCHNEGANLHETLAWLMEQNYPDYEVIAIDDGSDDDSGALLDSLVGVYERLRVIHLSSNQGKAIALRMGALAARHEFLVAIDADALLDPEALHWLIRHFVGSPRVGAVTGNPRIRNRSTLLGRLQVGEYSAVIGLIKRTQRILGRIFTVSGVVVALRKSALHRTRYWSADMITEDMDLTWQLQTDHWDVRYEPNALCWILTPETLRGLWSQRLRWAQGGIEVLLRHGGRILNWRQRHMWPVVLEHLAGILWAHAVAALIALYVLGRCLELPQTLQVPTLLPQAHGLVLAVSCLLQLALSLWLDQRYEKGLWRVYLWTIWYPLAYWLLSMATSVAALPRVLLNTPGRRARWISPDRGVRPT